MDDPIKPEPLVEAHDLEVVKHDAPGFGEGEPPSPDERSEDAVPAAEQGTVRRPIALPEPLSESESQPDGASDRSEHAAPELDQAVVGAITAAPSAVHPTEAEASSVPAELEGETFTGESVVSEHESGAVPRPSDGDPEPGAADRTPEPDPALGRIERAVAGLSEGIQDLTRLSQRANDHATALHAENNRLRAGELAVATRPLTRDLVRLTDELDLLLTACDPSARSDVELVRSRVLEVLARWGVTRYSTEVGESFDARLHQGVGRIKTSEHPDGTIASIRKPGFRDDDGQVLRAAEVEMYAYVDPEPEPDPAPDSTDDPGPSTDDAAEIAPDDHMGEAADHRAELGESAAPPTT